MWPQTLPTTDLRWPTNVCRMLLHTKALVGSFVKIIKKAKGYEMHPGLRGKMLRKDLSCERQQEIISGPQTAG